jgi:O-antigen ligase
MFRTHPLVGIGVGNFPSELPLFLPRGAASLGSLDLNLDAHSVYVASLAETGLVGSCLLLLWLGSVAWEGLGWRIRRKRARLPVLEEASPSGLEWQRLMAGAAIAFLVFVAVAASVDLTRERFLMALAGLVHGLYLVGKEQQLWDTRAMAVS